MKQKYADGYTTYKIRFIDYLWGIETHIWCNNLGQSGFRFIDYLWGIETTHPYFNECVLEHIVYRLPMRNWNYNRAELYFNGNLLFIDYLWGIETEIMEICIWKYKKFIDYLWGIETL